MASCEATTHSISLKARFVARRLDVTVMEQRALLWLFRTSHGSTLKHLCPGTLWSHTPPCPHSSQPSHLPGKHGSHLPARSHAPLCKGPGRGVKSESQCDSESHGRGGEGWGGAEGKPVSPNVAAFELRDLIFPTRLASTAMNDPSMVNRSCRFIVANSGGC